jgi:hypothetical protein
LPMVRAFGNGYPEAISYSTITGAP